VSPYVIHFRISRAIFALSLILSIISWQISYFIDFVIKHDRLMLDLTLYGLLIGIGNIYAYKLISICRQHVYPLVSNVRKCFTVCVNVLWFGHNLKGLQWLGILMVFGGVLFEIISNYNLGAKMMKNEEERKKEG
jgi:UDP-galactose transporter B1